MGAKASVSGLVRLEAAVTVAQEMAAAAQCCRWP